ncbi:endonuclease I family protein [Aeoliella sp. SH292]|uniref:endonuclease I family protein n=1 Tax=Aeoliella sp. SH292 TaxID=3454464 RepID=UPI003F97A45C
MAVSIAHAVGAANIPPGYYSSATGTGTTLKSQLHNIIDGHTMFSYDALRTALQVTDADPNRPGHMLLVYDRVSLDLSDVGSSIPGWDNGNSWDREHTWPRSRGVDTSGPDNSDLHMLRPSTPSVNSARGSLNFGGAYGQPFGEVSDGGTKWYPGNADAGMIARQMFYMAVRYDGSDSATENLELATGNPGSTLGDLNRLVEWHYAAPADSFEENRNDIIYEDYQRNRNPFVDHPEWVWSVFVDQANDSRVSLTGTTPAANGSSTLEVDWGRAYVGQAVSTPSIPGIAKTGSDGTYVRVSSTEIGGQYDADGTYAFRLGSAPAVTFGAAGLANTSVAGQFSGTITVDNLDVTTAGGQGRGANDANDMINLSFDVLNHPVASFSQNANLRNTTIDLGSFDQGSGLLELAAGSVFNLLTGGPAFAANLDLDSVQTTGDSDVLGLSLTTFADLVQGAAVSFDAVFDTSVAGSYSSTFEFMLSGEDLPGEQTQTLSLTLLADVIAIGLEGDFNDDGFVDLADYVVWRDNLGSSHGLAGNGVDDGIVDALDYAAWKSNFGAILSTSTATTTVPEPSTNVCIALLGLAMFAASKMRRA